MHRFANNDSVYLSPDEPDSVFYEKMKTLTRAGLERQLDRFDRYALLAQAVRFQKWAFDRRPSNVSVSHNDLYGWHLTSCPWSNPHASERTYKVHCSCREDIQHPERYFHRIDGRPFDYCSNCRHDLAEAAVPVKPERDPTRSDGGGRVVHID